MSDIPPRQPVNGTASARVESAYGLPPLPQGDQPPDIDATGALVSLHQAATQSGPDSFPVLKAFQEYLESERRRARHRVALVTSLFAGIVVVLIAVFLAAGILLFNYMKEREERLWHRLESQTAVAVQPAAVPMAPAATASEALEREMQRLGKELAALRIERHAAREAQPPAAAAPAAAVIPPPAAEPAVAAAAAGSVVPAGATAPAIPPPAAAPAVAAATAGSVVPTGAAVPAAPAPAASVAMSAAPAAAAVPAAAAPSVAPVAPRRSALEIPVGVTPPAPPVGFATSAIYLRPGGRGAPIPWNVYVPAQQP